MTQLSLDQIRVDYEVQSRAAGLNLAAVDDFAEDMRAGDVFPPVMIFQEDEVYWLADGFHRVEAAKRAGLATIGAQIAQGTRRDAILHSVGANRKHGLRDTPEDKRQAVLMLLNDEEWAAWGDREISRRCNVSPTFVGKIRKDLTVHVDSEASERTYITKHGTVATMNTANIGKTQPAAELASETPMEEGMPSTPARPSLPPLVISKATWNMQVKIYSDGRPPEVIFLDSGETRQLLPWDIGEQFQAVVDEITEKTPPPPPNG